MVMRFWRWFKRKPKETPEAATAADIAEVEIEQEEVEPTGEAPGLADMPEGEPGAGLDDYTEGAPTLEDVASGQPILGPHEDTPPELPELASPEPEPLPDQEEAARELGEPKDLTPEQLGITLADLPALEVDDPAEWHEDETEDVEEIVDPIISEEPFPQPPILAGTSDFLAYVQSSSAVGTTPNGSDCQWTYSCKRCQKSAAGYGAANWTVSGDAFTARNLNENINDEVAAGANPFGNGVNEEDIDINADNTDDLPLQPIPANTPVIVRVIPVNDDDDEYWIIASGYQSGLSGGCP